MNAVADLVSSLQIDNTKRVQCPSCSSERKKYGSKDLAIHSTSDGWRYFCHHCNIAGFVPFKTQQKTELNVIPLIKFE